MTVENGKLKIWLERYAAFDKKKIRELDDETEFLVFKVAVATGWDCPRAQVLVKFREGNSETFEIQTIGRILRTAERKSYENQLLDNAYLYTNLSRFIITRDSYTPNRIKTEVSYFRTKNGHPVYTPINLISYYKSRKGDYNSADSSFYSFFEKEFCIFFEIDEYDFATTKLAKMEKKHFSFNLVVEHDILVEIYEKTTRLKENQIIVGPTTDVKISENEISYAYYNLIRENLNGLAYARSKSIINGAIVETLTRHCYLIPKNEKISVCQKLFITNKEIFTKILSNATHKFRNYLIMKTNKPGVYYNFEISLSKSYVKENNQVVHSDLSLYQPLRLPLNQNGEINRLELSFINYLDSRKDVIEWFWKNGDEHMKENFGIAYNNGLSTFQPDFIIKFINGTIGIFDTKPVDDIRFEDTKDKAEALYKYIVKANSNRDPKLGRIIGGIVISKDYDPNTKTYKNFLIYHQEKYYNYHEKSHDWESFETLLNKIKPV